MLKKYKIGFDLWSLILFVLMMVPTILWSFIVAPNDILRVESVTPVFDIIASISQSVMIAVLCLLINKNAEKVKISPMIIATIVCSFMYFAGWAFYFSGVVNPIVILDVTVPPCLAFLFYAIDRKNIIAIIPNIIFLICHLIYAIINFII